MGRRYIMCFRSRNYSFVCTCTVYYNYTTQDVILTRLAAISALLPFIRSVRITSVTRPYFHVILVVDDKPENSLSCGR